MCAHLVRPEKRVTAPSKPSVIGGAAAERRIVRIVHGESGLLIAEGPLGWAITPFEGNYYVRAKYLRTDRLKVNFLPGLCPYKFLYVWLDLHLPNGRRIRNLAWKYWLPNPLLPFIWFRVALPSVHPELAVERVSS